MIVRRKKIKYFKNVRIIVVRVDQRHKNIEGGGEGRGGELKCYIQTLYRPSDEAGPREVRS